MYPYSHGWCQGHPPAWWHIRCRCCVTLLSAIPSPLPSVTHRVTIAISRLQQSPGHGHRLSVRHYSALTTSQEALFYDFCVSCGDSEWRNISIPMWATEQTGNCTLLEEKTEDQKTQSCLTDISLKKWFMAWCSVFVVQSTNSSQCMLNIRLRTIRDNLNHQTYRLWCVVCYSDNKDFLFKVPWWSIFEFDFALYLRVTRTCTHTQMGVAFLKVISDVGVTFLSAS